MTETASAPRLVLATGNRGKVAELAAMLAGIDMQVVAMGDVDPGWEPVEDGNTFEANAVIKAVSCARATRSWALADDSGLEVDALGGAPGVHSARYAGSSPRSDEANNRKLLDALSSASATTSGNAAANAVANVVDRSARFRAVLVLASPTGEVQAMTEGVCEGRITLAPRGENGFGYDPIFEANEGNGKTMAELDDAEKNRLSHRGRAVMAMRPMISQRVRQGGHGTTGAGT